MYVPKTNGLYKSWLNLGDFFTPAYEYEEQSGVYGNGNLRADKYVDMYRNYLSQVPLIKKFNASIKKQQ